MPSADCSGGHDPDFRLVGWATTAGGTTGGRGGSTLTVYSGAQLRQAIDNKSPFMPLTILVNNTITRENTGNERIDLRGVRDLSIIGLGERGVFSGVGLKIWESGNIVLRNLRIHHVNIGEADAISLQGPADHIWVDHCELYNDYQGVEKDAYDGLIDAKSDVRYLTYSWNKLYDSWKVHLAGSTESDVYDRKLTMHHNWIENVGGGAPSYRGGTGHVFNNYFKDVDEMAINSRLGACLRVENNVFENVQNPWVSAYSLARGGVEPICNEIDEASVFAYAGEILSAMSCTADIPYDYAAVLTETQSVADVVMNYAGVGKLATPQQF